MSIQKIRALIFDMDGTMIDSMPTHKAAWIEFARRYGIEMDVPEMMRRTTGRTGAECMSELFGRRMTSEEALPFVREKEDIYRKLYAPIFSEVKGFKAFMDKARSAGLALGIGTAGDAANVAFAFSHLCLNPEPSVVVRGDMGLAGKPEPAIFLEAAMRLGFAPHECVVFEDAPFGIEAARRAGMQAVAITTTHSAQELVGDHVIAVADHYDELLATPTFMATLFGEVGGHQHG
ncbi:MAG: HAD family phosphatase [Cytophagales bacterium]|nr:HAD family phosphatase [Cytophagales bacterium]